MLSSRRRTAVVSGGSGEVGIEIIRQCLDEGMNVAAFHSSDEKADMTKRWLKRYGNQFTSCSGDIAESFAKINEKFGGIDVIVCGQGWPPEHQDVEEITNDYWNGVINSNLTRSFQLLQQALPYLRQSPAPRIIFLTSYEARSGGSGDDLAYSAAKGGVISLTYAAARRLAREGITVNAVAMGGIHNKPYPVSDEYQEHQQTDPSATLDQIPLGRLGKPEDISAAVCYLASEAAGFVTGEVLNVNGGQYMG